MALRKIKMKETRRGTEDGFTMCLYESGKEYVMGDSLSASFLQSGFAEFIEMVDTKNGRPV